MELTAYRALFPVTEKHAYLRHASIGPISSRVRASVEECLTDIQYVGDPPSPWYLRREEARGLAARLIGADPRELAFPRNTSQGLLWVIHGIDWREGDNVVTAETEDVAVVLPLLGLKRDGVETRFAPSQDGRIAVQDVLDLVDARTRLVALSFVEVWTGFRNDLAAIGKVCRERGVYFCVDAIQGLGALQLSVRENCIDFMTAGGHKWLLSPLGVGIFYCREELIGRHIPALAGWTGFSYGEHHPYEAPLLADARRFDEGSPNWCGLYALGESLRLLLEVGPDRIEAGIKSLTDGLIEGLQAKGYDLVTPADSWAERSGIVSFGHATHDSAEIYRRLLQAGVVVSHSDRWRSLRVAPHFYNTEEEVERLLQALP